ncbi:MAG: ATP-binding protein [Chloroflexia bacterium]|nr:ATP-binding protein [Chloroflexia bacterium]
MQAANDIKLSLSNENIQFNTDPALLIRVLINMVKNAFEAKNQLPEITIGCYHSNGSVAFFVNNHAYIEEQYAKCIFQPMFSTKGTDRGLGTYSIRLIGENYLKGKVWFKTNRDSGTTFTIEVPVNV